MTWFDSINKDEGDVDDAIDELEEIVEEFDLTEHEWSSVDDASDYLFEHKYKDKMNKSLDWFEVVKKKKSKKHPALKRAGVSGFSKPKRTPDHKTKSHIVVVKDGDKVKTIRFGQKGVKTNQTAGQRKAFKSRHAKNIKRGKTSAAYWANKVKWSPSKTKEKKNKKWRKGS
tara:strand:+ start:942 stop:1454 length:513 start_codon:yes stop_codon:yes gene_type:complete